ncbi:hypothetical protein FRC10_005551 [Ceratobasidium sp. 414]|nr:hypothetical protein FRC10_005551 [Ceratobasidium sp. 414]
MDVSHGEGVAVTEKWSEFKLVTGLKQLLRQKVFELKDKQFSMYKADVPLDEADEIQASDVRD